jgi:hypothetical protein
MPGLHALGAQNVVAMMDSHKMVTSGITGNSDEQSHALEPAAGPVSSAESSPPAQ